MNSIKTRLQQVHEQIKNTAAHCRRDPAKITLLAVSKNHDVEQILQAVEAGCRDFGESYVQEAVGKIERLGGQNINWHFIGPIQSNKTRQIAEHFQWVHSVERVKIARRLNDHRPEGLPALNICVQVNITGETTKTGISLQQLPELVEQIQPLDRLRLRGLMTIARKTSTTAELRQSFVTLRQALQRLNSTGLSLDTLSMGMSGDLDVAIEEGATIVRVGTGIFGPRPY